MKPSDLNHLRRLLGWVRCDIGQAPADMQRTMIDIADKLGHPQIDDAAKGRLVEGYRRAEAVPQYVRDAVKALEKVLPAAGRKGGHLGAQNSPKTRADAGVGGGLLAGRPLPEDWPDDVEIERGLAEIGVYVWGPRAEDWLAGVYYAARLLGGSHPNAAAAALQNHPNAAAKPLAGRDIPANPPTLRRGDTGGLPPARQGAGDAGLPQTCRSPEKLQAMQEDVALDPMAGTGLVVAHGDIVRKPTAPLLPRLEARDAEPSTAGARASLGSSIARQAEQINGPDAQPAEGGTP